LIFSPNVQRVKIDGISGGGLGQKKVTDLFFGIRRIACLEENKSVTFLLDAGQQQKLADYLALLQKWNRAYNLTAVRDRKEMVARQLLDSLAILQLVRGACILDVVTGAGLPGIPLVIALLERGFSLIDFNGKKTQFMRQARLELGLDNVEVVRSRVEVFRPQAGFNIRTSRAFVPLRDIVESTTPLLIPGRSSSWKRVDRRWPRRWFPKPRVNAT
jgi:16S rRNA (guanine527-N7)-methyltransferase